MARTQPVPSKNVVAEAVAAGSQPGATASKPAGPAAFVTARSPEARTAINDAKGMPGWQNARRVLGEALKAGNTALFVESRGNSVSLRRRVSDTWEPSEPLAGGDGVVVFAALKQLAGSGAPGQGESDYEVGAKGHATRRCHVAKRTAAGGEDVLILLGDEVPNASRGQFGRGLKAALSRLVPSFLRRRPPVSADALVLPRVSLEPIGEDAEARRASIAEAEGFPLACTLFAGAVQARACRILFEASPHGVSGRFDVDGLLGPALDVDALTIKAVVSVLESIAGIDPKARGRQVGKMTAMVENKAWPCFVVEHRGSEGARCEVVIEHGRPKLKTLSDAGMSVAVADRVQELLKLESGLIVLAAPPRGGLSTLFDVVVGAADRLLRDFILLEDASAPRPEIQNVKPVRWDSKTGGRKPVDALDAALREYPNVLTACDLEDPELAQRLVEQAGEGKLVILGLRAVDAGDSLTKLLALGVEPALVGRVLLGAVSARLVRKLCPQCRQEYLPTIEMLSRLRLELGGDVTLFRSPPGGCSVCTGTGYLGRTAACELAAGPTLRTYVAKAADTGVLRKAAVKDGMVSILQDAIAKAARGVTSIEEVQRVFQAS